jgi:hypothetical protein
MISSMSRLKSSFTSAGDGAATAAFRLWLWTRTFAGWQSLPSARRETGALLRLLSTEDYLWACSTDHTTRAACYLVAFSRLFGHYAHMRAILSRYCFEFI